MADAGQNRHAASCHRIVAEAATPESPLRLSAPCKAGAKQPSNARQAPSQAFASTAAVPVKLLKSYIFIGTTSPLTGVPRFALQHKKIAADLKIITGELFELY
jgi:hypothetical protein